MPPGGGVLKAEGVGLVAGLGVFKQQPPGVKGEAGHHHHPVEALQVQQLPVPGGGPLHRHTALGGGDPQPQLLLNVFVDGPGGDLGGEAGDHGLGKIVEIPDQGFAVQIAHPLDGPQGLPHQKAALGGQPLVGGDGLKADHPGHRPQMVAAGGLLEALDHPHQKGGLAHRAVDHPHPLALDGLDVALGGEIAQSPPQGVAGAAVLLDQGAFRGQQALVGIILGLTLVSGQLLNAYSVATTPAADIPKWDFGFVQVNMIGYQAQVIPAVLAAFTLVYLEKFFRKICPAVVSMIVVPFCSLVLAVMAAHFVLGPIGWAIGSAISSVVYAGISGPFRVVFGAVFGFIYAPLVITGLHHMSNAIDLQLIADFGGTMLWPMIALSNIAQGSAVLGVIYLQRKNAAAQEVNIPACISCYLGVTEPAMFGVNLKLNFPFLCGMIGSAIAGVVCTATSTTANAIGVGGLPGILSIQPQYMLSFALCMLIALVVPFVLTVVIGKKKHVA